MASEKLQAFDESAQKAQVIQLHGHEQPPVDEDYLKSLLIPEGIDFAEYAENRESEKDNIKPVRAFYDELVLSLDKNQPSQGATMPWTKTHEKIRFRKGEVTMWHGYSGHKKSMVLGYVALGFMQQNAPVCIASFEMRPVTTLSRMLKQATGTIEPTQYALDGFLKFTDSQLWIYDKQGTMTQETLFGVIFYAADKLGVQHFVIDSLMRVVPNEDDYNAQKNFVIKLCEIAKEANIHIHFVHHNRKGDESREAGSQGAKGTGAIKDNVDNAIEVWTQYKTLAEKQLAIGKDEKVAELPDTYVICTKQRNGDWEGKIALWFDYDSLQFKGARDAAVRTWTK
jgi:twinkle protein